MTYPIFKGKGQTPIAKIKDIPKSQLSDLNNPRDYQCSDELMHAVNVALIMNQPLLLTGEPGSGKTQLAHRVAWELELGPPLTFETKSNSTAQDLFYTFNALARFHAANRSDSIDVDDRDFITYQALGEAIIQANTLENIKHILPSYGFVHKGPKRSVVLIDEIDKAPRDFPNDILNEIERMFFKIPQLDIKLNKKSDKLIEAPNDNQPIVIMTSNSEKQLPDAFLRRCVFHYIEFPDEKQMDNILRLRLPGIAEQSSGFIKSAISLFFKLREKDNALLKKPSTGELIIWINVMRRMAPEKQNPMETFGIIFKSLGTLVKNNDDIKKAKEKIMEWMENQKIESK